MNIKVVHCSFNPHKINFHLMLSKLRMPSHSHLASVSAEGAYVCQVAVFSFSINFSDRPMCFHKQVCDTTSSYLTQFQRLKMPNVGALYSCRIYKKNPHWSDHSRYPIISFPLISMCTFVRKKIMVPSANCNLRALHFLCIPFFMRYFLGTYDFIFPWQLYQWDLPVLLPLTCVKS